MFRNFAVGKLNGEVIRAPFEIVRDSTEVPAGVKLLEIDPRGREARWTGIDERGRKIAMATMKAIAEESARRIKTGVFA